MVSAVGLPMLSFIKEVILHFIVELSPLMVLTNLNTSASSALWVNTSNIMGLPI